METTKETFHKSTKSCRNIYKNARKIAGLKREAAAEELNICPRSLDIYESIDGHPPDDIVRKMCILYDNNFLAYQHLKQSPLGEFLPELTEDNIQGATLNLICNFMDVQDILQEIAKFATGQTDELNSKDWSVNRTKLIALTSSLLTLLLADKGGIA